MEVLEKGKEALLPVPVVETQTVQLSIIIESWKILTSN
jgi:hypothetical protein